MQVLVMAEWQLGADEWLESFGLTRTLWGEIQTRSRERRPILLGALWGSR